MEHLRRKEKFSYYITTYGKIILETYKLYQLQSI